MRNKSVLLIGFYNTKALGVRYLEHSLRKAGFEVYILFLKEFNSVRPEPVTQEELMLLEGFIRMKGPGLIGLSVMSSLYLETVMTVNDFLRKHFDIPIVWGGVYPTLFPEKCLRHTGFVLRGEGEEALPELAQAIINAQPYQEIRNLACRSEGKLLINEVRPLREDLDTLGFPLPGHENKFFIDNNRLVQEDPLLKSVSFELIASRGCPFMCSYCSSINLKRLYKGKGSYLRYRSASSVIQEILHARSLMKNLKVIRFWDEIFPDDRDWIEDFATQYKEQIQLPFEIWVHPLRIHEESISRLVEAGLFKAVMGIQSGSPAIRKEIFHRTEKQQDILGASKILSRQRVPQVVYDFMLRHPFEKVEDLRQTWELCMQLARPFELQLHGLSFLPGTDILKIARDKGIPTGEDADDEACRPILEQYRTYWGKEKKDSMTDFWYSLIVISPFHTGRFLSRHLAKAEKASIPSTIVPLLPSLYEPLGILRSYGKKVQLLVRATLSLLINNRMHKGTLKYSEDR